jgi:hypothetical protein
MPRFGEIFDAQTPDHKSETNTLNDRARAAGREVLHPGESIRLDDETTSIVISGVTWSKPDLEVLDELVTRDTSDTRVWFINPDYVFPDERILPGASRMVQTPVLAEYTGKRLVSFLQGGSVSGCVIDRIRSRFPVVSR